MVDLYTSSYVAPKPGWCSYSTLPNMKLMQNMAPARQKYAIPSLGLSGFSSCFSASAGCSFVSSFTRSAVFDIRTSFDITLLYNLIIQARKSLSKLFDPLSNLRKRLTSHQRTLESVTQLSSSFKAKLQLVRKKTS